MSEPTDIAERASSAPQFELTVKQKRYLLEVARGAVIDGAKHRRLEFPEKPESSDTVLGSRAGAFVTLYGPGHTLRGCIGYIEGEHHLPLTIALAAEAAATRDSRFSPVDEEELDDLTISISVLTPPVEIDDPQLVKPGVHGLIIQRGFNRGLLLPQVATERGWDRETFLGHTCNKAGLPDSAWREVGVKISVFSALVFSEEEGL